MTPLLRRPDVMIGNLEGTLTRVTTSTKCEPGSEDCVAFRSPPEYARLFAAAGYDVLSVANNHSHDFGPAGLAETRAAVRGVGLAVTGGPDDVAVRTVRGIRVAVVGFAPYGWAAPLNDPAAVRALVGRAAAAADVVVVVFHGGAEGAGALHVPAGRETAFGEDRGDLRAFARTAIAAGAHAVLGAGPHVVRGMETVEGRPVAYSVGNLVGYRTLSSAGRHRDDRGAAPDLRGGRGVAGRAAPADPAGRARLRRAGPGAGRGRAGGPAVPGGLRPGPPPGIAADGTLRPPV